MSLRERLLLPESFDAPGRSEAEVVEGYRQLGKVNRLFRFAHPFQHHLPKLLGRKACRRLTLLDVGAGDCSLGAALERWAERRGWGWRATHLDLSPAALQLNGHSPRVAGLATKLPFTGGAFDVVIASQMTHHLDQDAEVEQHFREAWRVCRRAVVISDLHRSLPTLWLVKMCVRVLGLSREIQRDGAVSVGRGFRVSEWQRHAKRAGIPDARIWTYAGARILLAAVKP